MRTFPSQSYFRRHRAERQAILLRNLDLEQTEPDGGEAMNLKSLYTLILLGCVLFVSCSGNPPVDESGETAALTRASELVSELNQSIESDYPLAPAAWNGVPVVIITVESADSDYQPTVESIVKAAGSFEGDLQVAVETPMEISDAERASQVKDARFIVAHFDARTGERIP